jgi:hypothetical protein
VASITLHLANNEVGALTLQIIRINSDATFSQSKSDVWFSTSRYWFSQNNLTLIMYEAPFNTFLMETDYKTVRKYLESACDCAITEAIIRSVPYLHIYNILSSRQKKTKPFFNKYFIILYFLVFNSSSSTFFII